MALAGQLEIKVDNNFRRLNPVEGQKLLQAIDEKLSSEPNYQDLIDVATGLPPIIPYRAPDGANQQNFEWSTLAQHLLVQKKHYHPVTKQRLVPADLGRRMVANYILIAKIDALLLAENSSRRELLACFNIKEDLYNFLLEYQHDPNEDFSERTFNKILKRYGAKALMFYLVATTTCIIDFSYRLTVDHPELIKSLYQATLESFQTTYINDPGYFYLGSKDNTKISVQTHVDVSSPICQAFPTSWPSFQPFNNVLAQCVRDFTSNSKLIDVSSSSGIADHPGLIFRDSLPHISLDFKPRTNLFHILSTAVLTFTSFKIYDHYRNERPWQNLLADKKVKIALLLNVGIILIGIDGYFDCFGLVSWYQKEQGTVVEACKIFVEACNKGQSKTDVIGNESLTFKLPNNLPTETLLIVSRKTGAAFNMLAPGAVALMAGRLGFLANKNRDRDEAGKEEFVALKKRQYRYLLPAEESPQSRECPCNRCVIL